MEHSVNSEGPFTVVSLVGDVDLQNSPQARQQILHQVRAGNDVLVDLSAVNYIDSSGVASLVEGFQVAREMGNRFGLTGVSDTAMQVLHLARLDQVFDIRASVAVWLEGE